MMYPIDKQERPTLVIHCSDPRFQSAIRQFIKDKLRIRSYAPLIIGGGVHAFGVQTELPGNFNTLWEQIRFFIEVLKVEHIIMINHEDCIWYRTWKKLYPEMDPMIKEKLDLQTAVKTIVKEFSHVDVRTYWAGLKGNQIAFEEVK